eukprot:403336555
MGKWTSASALICYFFIIVAFVLPIILVTRTHNFWVRRSTYYEQPNINHLNEALVIFQTTTGTQYASVNKKIIDLYTSNAASSSFSVILQYILNYLQVQNFDQNDDGLTDRIMLRVESNIDPSTIRSIMIIQQFSYQISTKIEADIKLTTFNLIQTPLGASQINALGTLELNQRNTFAFGTLKRIINYDTDNLHSQLQEKSILEFYQYINQKNVTLDYQVENLDIIPGSGSSTLISMDLRIPSLQQIVMVPSVLESLKNAWIQYLALLIPCLWAIYHLILGFAFRNRVLPAQIKSNIPEIKAIKGF